MRSGIRRRPGDLVVVPFPSTDLSSIEARPAIVPFRPEYDASSRDVIVLGVTSNLTNASHRVLSQQENMAEGDLLATRGVNVDRVATLSPRIA